ncbi:hypothetical protein KW842_04015 [Duganella sp. sic0402]|uniref:hypothetical protein n=1 Tax=Duganella sp. sic0402 TaxID=2854786 RepID=UPI001C449CDC|nr:hypothetical protein [Duganella sp. sic0402]MBV7534929.1 hypothetical protein [Duganella sp. sic0402]
MTAISLFLLIAGAALLILGFKKNNRALLVAAAFVWLAHGAGEDFVRGFKDGISHSAKPAAT